MRTSTNKSKTLCAAIALAAVALGGCLTVSQTSCNIAEKGVRYYFAVPSRAVAAYEVDGETFIKCPVVPFEKTYTTVQQALTPSYCGGYWYSELPTEKEEYAYFKVNENKERFCGWQPDSGLPVPSPKFILDTEATNIAERVEGLEPIPLPEGIRERKDFGYSLDAQPYGMYPTMPLIREETSDGHGFCVGCAILDGVVVDFPLSVVMTLTGSLWYYPLSQPPEGSTPLRPQIEPKG